MVWEGAVARWAPLHRARRYRFGVRGGAGLGAVRLAPTKAGADRHRQRHQEPGSDITGLSNAQDKLRSIPLGVTDPKALCEALEYQVERTVSGTVFTLAEIPLPGGGSIPLTVDVATLAGALGGGS